MNSPKVTVIIPCKNDSFYLPKSLDSLILQTHSSWEVIVVDGGSTDNSRGIVTNYMKKFPNLSISLINSKPKCIAALVNQGIRKGKGEYLSVLNCGDVIKNPKTRKAVEGAREQLYNGDSAYCL